ncbi:MAG TPA: ATP-binding protein [Stellaceae bacterium]|jgi:signal transduction histidine kinase|nr:ATP-binding protein [Stellaceae bacterium]
MNFLFLDRPRFPQNSFRAYVVAAAVVGAALALHLVFARWFLSLDVTGLPFATFFLAVIAVTFLCGSVAGLFAGFLSMLLAWQFTIASGNASLSILQTGMFGVGALTVSAVIGVMRAASAEREQLRQELFHAQRLDALGRLAGGIAHDINNSLVPVVAMTSMVLKRLPPDSADAESLKMVREAADHIKLLVQQILAFGRPHEPQTVPVDPTAFLRDTLHFVRATVPTTIDIAAKLDPAPLVCVDASQFRQVLINLITNAVDAIGERQGTITVGLSEARPAALQGRLCVRLSIGDDGSGMDDETRGRVFEPFFTTKEVDKGTGLGLSVVYGIVGAHGGRIDVTSAVGQGTRFDIFLPAMVSQDDPLTQDALIAA